MQTTRNSLRLNGLTINLNSSKVMKFCLLKKLKIMARISLQGMAINLTFFTGLFAMTPVAHSQPSNVPCSVRIAEKSVLETFQIIEHQTSYTFAYFSSGLNLE